MGVFRAAKRKNRGVSQSRQQRLFGARGLIQAQFSGKIALSYAFHPSQREPQP